MKSLNSKELKEKSVEELQTMIANERASLYAARRELVFRRLTDRTSLKVQRHNIARMLTALTEKNKNA